MLILTGGSAFAQGTIFGTVTNSGGSTPANGEISFFGFLSDTDEEIKINSSDGTNYDAGNWFDNFQNYLTESAGNPYDYYFFNATNSEGFHLAKLQPSNSFQREDITLAPVSWPSEPTGLSAQTISTSAVLLRWNGVGGLTWHVYRRDASSNGSFFRLDNPTGQLTDVGVADSFYIDATVDGVISYDYLIIAEDGAGNYSPHSAFVTVNSSVATAPVVTSITPASGPEAGGTSVSIIGDGFDQSGATATIGGVALTSVSIVSPFEMTGITQAGPAGSADVVVTNTASGLSSAPLVGGFMYIGNAPPVLDPIGAKVTDEDVLLSFGITASDPNGTIPTLSVQSLPTGATITDNGGGSWTFDWTPTFTQSGIYSVTFTVSDGALVDSEVVQITVNDVNRPPLLDPIGPKTVDENQPLSFNVTASDPDGPIPSVTASPLPPGAVLNDIGGGSWTFDWTPTFDQAGVYSVTFTASDGSLSDSEVVQITVSDVNRPPVLNPIGSKSVDEGGLLSFPITAVDPDGTPPTLSASGMPMGSSLTDNGGGNWTFDWPTAFGDAGVFFVTFVATDIEAAADSEIVQITVNNINEPPVLDPIGPRIVDENQLLSFAVTASDPDGTVPMLSAAPLPAGATITDNGGGDWTFDWRPTFNQSGIYDITFTVTDDSAAVDSEVVRVTVNNINQPPVLDPIGSQSVDEGLTLSFTITASDPDGIVTSLTANPLFAGASIVDNGGGNWTFNWPTSLGDVGLYIVTFTATDDSAAVDSEVVQITVNNVNEPPVLDPIGSQAVDEGQLLSFTVTASDPDGTIPTLTATPLPVGASITDNGGGIWTFNWLPAYSDAGLYLLSFLATDDSLAVDSEIVQITVNDINPPPVLSPIGPQTTQESVILTITVSASDPDGSTPVLSASNLPLGATFTDNLDGTGTFNWLPDTTQAGLYSVTFFASDTAFVDSEIVQITVSEGGQNLPPVLAPIGPKSVQFDTNLNFTVSATDPNGTIPDLRTSALPPGASFVDHKDGTGTFDWTPTVSQIGEYQIVFQAQDLDLAFDFEIVTVTVFSPSCCLFGTGNVDCDPNNEVDIADLTVLIDHLFISFAPLCCIEEGNVDGDAGGDVDIADLTLLIDHLFISFVPTAPCL